MSSCCCCLELKLDCRAGTGAFNQRYDTATDGGVTPRDVENFLRLTWHNVDGDTERGEGGGDVHDTTRAVRKCRRHLPAQHCLGGVRVPAVVWHRVEEVPERNGSTRSRLCLLPQHPQRLTVCVFAGDSFATWLCGFRKRRVKVH
jgi:hypothetical protein